MGLGGVRGWLAQAALEGPDRPALVTDAETLSYSELLDAAARRAGALAALGIRPGDRVAFVTEPTPTVETFVAIHAVWHLGATLVPLHPRLTAAEIAVILDEAAPVRLVTLPLPAGEPAPSAAPESLAVLFTSGTTGRPKGAVLSARAFAAAAEASAANLGWRDDDRWLLALTPAHVGGLSILVRCLLARRTVVAGPLAPETIARRRVTLVSLVPTQAQRLLAEGWTPPAHLRGLLLGGGPAPPALLAAADDRGWPVLTTYGLTEACAQVTTQKPGTRNRGEQGAGPPLPGLGVRISTAGSIQVGGPTLMSGYLRQPAPFTDDGWLDTGDLGRLDDAGCLHVLARRTDLIVTGGENVYPAEVEAALIELPGIAAACVFGIPDETWGQIVCAVLVTIGLTDALAARLATRLAPFKRPRRIVVVDSLPLGPTGKIDRAAAAAQARRMLGSGAEESMPRKLKKNAGANEGEGSKTAAKEYDDRATQHAQSGEVPREAKEAREAVEGAEADTLREAEAEGKKHIQEEDSELRK